MRGEQATNPSNMADFIPSLPDEVFGMICQELGLDRDFGSLYRCAQASRSFADPALRTMYKYVIVPCMTTLADVGLRYHEVSPGFLQSDEFDPRLAKADFATKFADAEQVFRRWTVLWRSIILSSLSGSQVRKNLFPETVLLKSAPDLQALLSLPPCARLP